MRSRSADRSRRGPICSAIIVRTGGLSVGPAALSVASECDRQGGLHKIDTTLNSVAAAIAAHLRDDCTEERCCAEEEENAVNLHARGALPSYDAKGRGGLASPRELSLALSGPKIKGWRKGQFWAGGGARTRSPSVLPLMSPACAAPSPRTRISI